MSRTSAAERRHQTQKNCNPRFPDGAFMSPPAHVPLSAKDRPHWSNIVAERPSEQWTEHQLDMAAILARTMADLEQQQRLCSAEGTIIVGARGGKRANPRNRCVNHLLRQAVHIRTSLGLSARTSL